MPDIAFQPQAHDSSEAPASGERCCAQPAVAFESLPDEPRSASDWKCGVAYVLMGYPRLSESFISQEIQVLERLGARLRLFAVKTGDSGEPHASVRAIRAPLTYLPKVSSLSGAILPLWLCRNLPAYLRAHLRLARLRPRAYRETLCMALGMSWRYRDGPLKGLRKVFVKEFLQAGHIALAVLEAGDVGHLHGHFCHGATTVTWFASQLTGIPFSFTAHAKDIYQADQNPGDLLSRKLCAASFVVTCTDANRLHLEQRHRVRVHTIYHGLNTEYFSPRHRGAEQTPPLILAVGRMVEKKGFPYLIDACSRLRGAGYDFRCLIVGEEGEQSATLRALILEHGLQSHFTIQGPVTHDALRSFYACASVFVLPCLVAADGDRDGIPNVLAEAMAMGLPVVTTPVSGIPEIVRDGENGLFVKPQDAAGLAAALARVLKDSALRSTLGVAARATIVEVFDAAHTTRRLKSMFEAALAAKEAAR